MKRLSIIALFCLTLLALLPVRADASEGIIRGTVRDGVTLQPLAGVNVTIEGTTSGAATDINGPGGELNRNKRSIQLSDYKVYISGTSAVLLHYLCSRNS